MKKAKWLLIVVVPIVVIGIVIKGYTIFSKEVKSKEDVEKEVNYFVSKFYELEVMQSSQLQLKSSEEPLNKIRDKYIKYPSMKIELNWSDIWYNVTEKEWSVLSKSRIENIYMAYETAPYKRPEKMREEDARKFVEAYSSAPDKLKPEHSENVLRCVLRYTKDSGFDNSIRQVVRKMYKI
jgi:hypothetical protein